MNTESDLKVCKCKNKKCQKILPEGYKYKYCEACRNRHAQAAKNVLKGFGAGVGALGGFAVTMIFGGKINPKR